MDLLGQLDQQDLGAIVEPPGPPVSKVIRVNQDPSDLKVHLVLMDNQETLDSQVQLASQDLLDLQVHKETPDHKDHPVNQDQVD